MRPCDQPSHPDTPPQSAPDVLTRIHANAAAADCGEITLADDLALLHASGVLDTVVSHTSVGCNAPAGTDLLRRIGRASLPVGRLVEGHANALRLLQLYGTARQITSARHAAKAGQIFGVWGAEGAPQTSVCATGGPDLKMSGQKRFCSGLGVLSKAIVPVQTAQGTVLLLVDVTQRDRGDASVWQVSGMRATMSGSYDFTGLSAEQIGQPDDYSKEPHFEGGIWRYCALHTGGLEALAEAVRQHVLARGQTDDPYQSARVAQLVILAQTARLWVESAATAVEAGTETQGAVTQALLARDAVEQSCVSAIAIAERALGTAAFDTRSEPDRIIRDLGFFLRQANLDGKLSAAARQLLADANPVGEMW